jgi:CHC2 zinc finger
MGVNHNVALWHRTKFLKAKLRESDDRINILLAYEDPTAVCLADIELATVFLPMAKELRAIALAIRGDEPKPGAITDEMIARAKAAPIERVVTFDRGMAPCFAHDDKKPSMSHWKNGNKASCFVCNKRWSALDVLIERDGLSYKEAVKLLAE